MALSSIFFPSFVTVEHQREELKGLDPRPPTPQLTHRSQEVFRKIMTVL